MPRRKTKVTEYVDEKGVVVTPHQTRFCVVRDGKREEITILGKEYDGEVPVVLKGDKTFLKQSEIKLEGEIEKDRWILINIKTSTNDLFKEKFRVLREKTNQMMGILPNSPKDIEEKHWLEAGEIFTSEKIAILYKSLSPYQQTLLDAFTRSLNKGLKIALARKELTLTWDEVYKDANPRLSKPRKRRHKND